MSDEVERIRTRLARVQSTGLSYDCPSGHCDDDDEPRCGSPDCEWRDEVSDIAVLLAALDASQREADRLRGDLAAETERADTGHRQIAARAEEARAYAERMRDEAEQLRRRIESTPPWPDDREPLDDEQMRALMLRWSTGPEQYQADADALIATTIAARAEAAQLRDFADRVRIERDHATEVETPTAIAEARDHARRAAFEEAIAECQRVLDASPGEDVGIVVAVDRLRALLDAPAAEPPCTCLSDAGWGSPRRSCARHP